MKKTVTIEVNECDESESAKGMQEVYAYLVIDDEGNEVICSAVRKSDKSLIRMITSNVEELGELNRIAIEMSVNTKKKIKLCRFMAKEVIGVI